MKRALFETVAVLPLVSGQRRSAHRLRKRGAGAHRCAERDGDREGRTLRHPGRHLRGRRRFSPFVDNPVNESGEAIVKNEGPAAAVANLDIDLVGCKEFIKITVTGGTAGALALGDAIDYPVHQVTAIAPASSGTGG